jgi:hypothetical protein
MLVSASIGEEGLVPGDEHVGEGEQPREDVVVDDPVGQVLEEQVGLLLVDVEAEVADRPVLSASMTAAVSTSAPRLVLMSITPSRMLREASASIRWCVSGSAGSAARRCRTRRAARSSATYSTPSSRHSSLGRGRGEHPAAEAEHDPGEHRADLAGADDPDGPAVQVEAEQAVQREVALADPVVGPVDLAVEREDQADGVLGDGVGRVAGDADDAQAEAARGGEVDVVEAGRAQGDQPDARGASSSSTAAPRSSLTNAHTASQPAARGAVSIVSRARGRRARGRAPRSPAGTTRRRRAWC